MFSRVLVSFAVLAALVVIPGGCGKGKAPPASTQPAPASQAATASHPTTASRPAAAAPMPRATTRPATISRFPARTHELPPAPGQTEAIYAAALEWIDRAIPYVDQLVPAAEIVADRFIGGGNLYAGGNGGFADELETRAGGFPFAQVWRDQRLTPWDVIFLGRFRPIEADAQNWQFDPLLNGRFSGGNVTVCFASRNWPAFERLLPTISRRAWGDRLHVLDTGGPDGGSLADISLNQMATTALAWAFQGEVIAAATRQGKTLATYASDWEPDGAAWDASVRWHHLHPKYRVPPIEPGKLGREYLTVCKRQLEQFLATGQADKVRAAARRLADCIQAGGVAWMITDGHIFPRGAFIPPELPHIRNMGRSWQWRPSDMMAPGDLLLHVGYLRYPKDTVRGALDRKCPAIVFCVDEGPADARVSHVGSCFTDWDTVVNLPDYPIRVLPSSGTLQTPQWYSLLAETVALQRPAAR